MSKKNLFCGLIMTIIVGGLICSNLFKSKGQFIHAQTNKFYVRDYGARGDGSSNDQKAIQRAINAASAASNGQTVEVVFDANKTYFTGNFFLKSNVTLVMGSGTTIKASNQYYDYEPRSCSDDSCDYVAPLIYAENVQNIGIRGAGDSSRITSHGIHIKCPNGQRCQTTCGSGGPCLIVLADVSGAVIKDIWIGDSETVTLELSESDDIWVENVTSRNSTSKRCNDNIDVFGSQDLTIKNCNIKGGDDNIALKVRRHPYCAGHMMNNANLEPLRNINIIGNTVHAPTGGGGLVIGHYEMSGLCSDVVWKDNVIVRDTKVPVNICPSQYLNENSKVRDMSFENTRFDDGTLVPLSAVTSIQPSLQCNIYWNGQLISSPCDTNCECAGWQNQGCGQGGCSQDQMHQTRTCAPAGCNTESRCIADSDCQSRPSISLSKTAYPAQVQRGKAITYTIHYQNTSQTTAYNVTITDNIPTKTAFNQILSNQCSYSNIFNNISCNLGSLASGGSGEVKFSVIVD